MIYHRRAAPGEATDPRAVKDPLPIAVLAAGKGV